jgi:hypothetical protein
MEPFPAMPLAPRVVHQLLLAVLTAVFDLVCGVRFTIVESPELMPFLPLSGGVGTVGSLLSTRFRLFDAPAPGTDNGLNPFSHSFRCSRNTAIVALASVTCPSVMMKISQRLGR